LSIARASGRVELEARETARFAVALHVPMVDPVVAEPAEEEVRERLVASSVRCAGRAAQPQRRVIQGQWRAHVERGLDLREAAPRTIGAAAKAHSVHPRAERPAIAFLVVDRAQGRSQVLVLETQLGSEELVEPR